MKGHPAIANVTFPTATSLIYDPKLHIGKLMQENKVIAVVTLETDQWFEDSTEKIREENHQC